ncbi:MAG: hypothetical protein WEH44_07270, partial [Pirellulaceae bacterium]
MTTITRKLGCRISKAVARGKKLARRGWRPALICYLMVAMLVIPLPPAYATFPPTPDPPDNCTPVSYCRRNPFGCYGVCQLNIPLIVCAGQPVAQACDPIFFRYGSVSEQQTDLHLSAQALDWAMERSYTSNTQFSGTSRLGNMWLGGPADMYLVQNGTDIWLLVNANSKRTFTGSGTPVTYTAPDDSNLQLVADTTNQQFILTDTVGNVRSTFHDFTVTNTLLRGKLKEQSTLQWFAQGKSGFQYSYDATTGLVSQITTPPGQDYSIVFSYSGSYISKVEIKNAGGTVVLEKVEYTYYENVTSPSTDIGTTGDLVQVKVSRQVPGDSSGTFSYVRYTQYRYSSGSTLKAVYNHDAIQRILSKLSLGAPADILQKADTFGTPQVKEFASKSFTFYTTATATSAIATPFSASENLNTLYGGAELDETGYVKSETIGAGC